MAKERFEKKYILIPILVFLNIFIGLLGLQGIGDTIGGTTPDSFYYFEIAEELPIVTESTFPILYPLTIKILSIFTQDSVLASKLVTLLGLLFIYIYTYRTNFFWKEIWIMTALGTFTFIQYWSWSENLLFPLLIIFARVVYMIANGSTENTYYIQLVAISFALLLTKYSSLFIILGLVSLLGVQWMTQKVLNKKLLISILSTAILVALYLGFNFYATGHMVGQRQSSANMMETLNIRFSLMNILYSLNPLLTSREIFGYKIHYIALAIVSIGIITPLIKTIFEIDRKDYQVVYVLIGLFFLAGTVLSFFITKLDNLNPRLLLPFVFFMYMYYITKTSIQKKYLYSIGLIALSICISNNIYLLLLKSH